MKAAEKGLLRLKKKILQALHKEDADFGLHVAANADMESLRRALLMRKDFKGPEARKIAREEAVDVLAFPEPEDFPHPESRKQWLGEVYINSNAAADGPGRMEFLLVHGVLHLLGYRHQEVRDIMKMEALERKICKKLKVPYS